MKTLKFPIIKTCIVSAILMNASCTTESIDESTFTSETEIEKNPQSIYSDVRYFKLETSAHTSGTSTSDFNTADEIAGIYQGIDKNVDYLFLQNQSGEGERTELKETRDRSLSDAMHGITYVAQPKNIPDGNGVTIGQIHHRSFDDSRPLVRIYCTTSKVEVKKFTSPISDEEGSELFGSIDFRSGDKLQIRLEMSGNDNIHVYVYNERTRAKIQRNEHIGDSDDSRWSSVNDYYFKLGVYNQGSGKAAHINIWDFDAYWNQR